MTFHARSTALRGMALAAAVGAFSPGLASGEEITFRYRPAASDAPESVSLRGEMNGWGDTPLTAADDGTWSVTVELPPGEYQYKFFIDGQWPSDMSTDAGGGPLDPEADSYVDDGFGGKNAVRTVGGGGPGWKDLPDLTRSRAHWVRRDVVVWNVAAGEEHRVTLVWSPDAGLAIGDDGLTGIEAEWELAPVELPAELAERFPHLRGRTAFRVPDEVDARRVLRGQPAVAWRGPDGSLLGATGLQVPGVLDDLWATSAPLGLWWDETGTPALGLWAPTARRASFLLFDAPDDPEPAARIAMTRDEDADRTGVWTVVGTSDWRGRWYLFEVEVYQPATGRIETNRVTDPYSRGLSADGRKSLLVDLDDPVTKPDGWDDLAKPPLAAPADVAIWELHVRDFSASDPGVPTDLAGTFRAFALDTPGTRHLKGLADAGLTHVHLLPAFDFATVPERRSDREEPEGLTGHGPASPDPQARIGAVRDRDSFNWGYDPVHWSVPEGSYATDPDGPARVREFREMVAALAGLGLRVVMDVVYNHTHASGQDERAVLDRIVPGYYHRLNDDGRVETSTCCQNTATEHAMMERLMIDDLLHWARDYKVDGFRFDLMGHHLKRNLVTAKQALGSLTLEEHGVDGSALYLYGEGWDFGEVGGGKRGVNATQTNMVGTGVGTFNDRFRDAVRGGNPFGDRREQGFATGRFLTPNGFQGDGAADRGGLLADTDRVRAGLAGNLSSFAWRDRGDGETNGAAHGAYGEHPAENVVYVSAHDNETFFDKVQYAAPDDLDLAARVRMQRLALSLTALAQGVPFFHAGVELLRSKSMDADSYDSGDWFNRLDFTYASNSFGAGLPPAWKNEDRWNVIGPKLALPAPGPDEIGGTAEHLREMLAIRKSSPLFRLRNAADVRKRVRFHNTGPAEKPGLIVMSVTDAGDGIEDLDPERSRVVVLFNAGPETVEFRVSPARPPAFRLHPVQADGRDEVVKRATWDVATRTFTVPGRTTAVFEE